MTTPKPPSVTQCIGGKLYSRRPEKYGDVCPFCRHETTEGMGDPRSTGFRKVAFRRHVFACFDRELAKQGYREVREDPKVLEMIVEKLPQKKSRAAKPRSTS